MVTKKKTTKKQTAVQKQEPKKNFWNIIELFKNKKEYVVFCLMILGALSLLAGIGLIIAANWAVIPDFVRVIGGLVVLGISLGLTGYLSGKGWTKTSEVALFVSYLLIGGNIALIQQTYNLDITWRNGCLIWSILGFPLALLAKFPLVRWCTVALLALGLWSYIIEVNHLVIAAILFLSFVGTMPLSETHWSRIRNILFWAMWVVLFIGDIVHHQEFAVILDMFTLIACLISISNQRFLLFYNLLFVCAGIRIIMLFWHAHNLNDTGIRLVICGLALLLLGGLYYKFFDKLQKLLQKWIAHE